MSTRKRSTTEATNKLTKENNEARKLILRNVANELFSLMQGTRKQCYGVIGLERRRAKNIYPWITDGMLDHQIKKLKKSQTKGVAIRDLQQATVTIDQLVTDLRVDAASNQTAAGRPHGSTVEALKTLDLRKRKAFDDAVGTDGRRRRQHPWKLWPWQTISWSPNLSVPWQNSASLCMLQPKRWHYIRTPEGDA